jgi:hypothetical protein
MQLCNAERDFRWQPVRLDTVGEYIEACAGVGKLLSVLNSSSTQEGRKEET